MHFLYFILQSHTDLFLLIGKSMNLVKSQRYKIWKHFVLLKSTNWTDSLMLSVLWRWIRLLEREENNLLSNVGSREMKTKEHYEDFCLNASHTVRWPLYWRLFMKIGDAECFVSWKSYRRELELEWVLWWICFVLKTETF